MPSLQTQVSIIDFLVVITLFTAASLLRSIFAGNRHSWLAMALPLAALGWGLAWMLWPPLVQTRLLPLPRGQAPAIIAIILLLISPMFLRDFRDVIRQLNWQPVAAFSYWRIVYGAILIGLGVQGALPAGFYWSAGFGDIAAGVWGMSLALRQVDQGKGEFKVWNLLALSDLLHVLVLGATFLRPFFIANPDIPPITLLPLAGVPIMIALHIMTAVAITGRRTELA